MSDDYLPTFPEPHESVHASHVTPSDIPYWIPAQTTQVLSGLDDDTMDLEVRNTMTKDAC
jgi:hypothetical protein